MRRLFALLALAAACAPSLGSSDSLVSSARVLAVRADPAEAPPGTKVTFTALVALPPGDAGTPTVTWSFCEAPKPLTTDNAVSNACLGADALLPAGSGESVTTTTPRNGCSLFGPDTPTGNFRPRDPDVTGGFYQPVRLELTGGATAFELARIHCDLPNAPADQAAQFAAMYHLNQNPTLSPVTATIGGAAADLSHVPPSSRVTFTASWPAAAAETFAWYDTSAAIVSTQREAMKVSWYATAGSFDTESTGRAADDMASDSANAWTAPATSGLVEAWIVLRDSRGGFDFASIGLTVAP
jgi:hypothetical protein